MDSTGASSGSLNGSSTTASASDSANAVPHYLRPFTGSCHDICKYGRRRASDEQPTKHKTTARVSMVVPSHRKKATARLSMVVPSQAIRRLSMVVPSPSSYAKSFPPRAKIHSPRRNASPGVKRGIALAQVQVKESNSPVVSGMSKQRGRRAKKPVRLDPSPTPPRASSDGVGGKRRRNEDALIGGDVQSFPSTSATMAEDGLRIKMPRTETESNGFEFEFEPIGDDPFEPIGEESDKLLSDTTTGIKRRRRRKSRVVKSGDDHNHNHNQTVKMKFRMGKTLHPHEGNDIFHKSLRAGPHSRTKDNHRSSKGRRRRVKCGKARILVLEDRRGDPRRRDIVIDETASKLAERRKGMVKSLVGAFETLISIQERKSVFHFRRMKD